MGTASEDNGKSLYRQIAAQLTDRVRSGAFGDRLPTLQQLAEEYDVGMVTVRRAVGVLQHEGVVTATRGRGIEPTRLRRGRTHTLGMVVGGVRTPLGRRLEEGVAATCQAHGQALATECYENDLSQQGTLVRQLVEDRQVDGLVLWLVEDMAEILAYLERERTPFVLLPEPDMDHYAGCHTVGNSDSGAAADVMTHLIGRGARQIRFVCGQPPETEGYVRHRYQRYRHSMKVAGLPVAEPLVVGKDEALVAQLRQCDAVFCATDTLACTVMRVCLAAGLRVPGELLVTGYDNTPAAELIGLTTVEQHFERIGEQAVSILLDDIEGRVSAPVHRIVRSELITRASTGRPIGDLRVGPALTTDN